MTRLILLSLLLGQALAHAHQPGAIYGKDDRKDYYEVDRRTQAMADATLIMVDKKWLHKQGDRVLVETQPYGPTEKLCSGEKFYEQGELGDCSGFLVAPDTLVTAGHCVTGPDDCAKYRWVAGFKVDGDRRTPTEVAPGAVLRCRKILARQDTEAIDYAVIQLSAPVRGVQPLSYRKQGHLADHEPVVMLGYPWGLPFKAAGGSHVRSVAKRFFLTDLDAFGGNSGSAVINQNSGEVEGILVSGDEDWTWDKKLNCRRAKRCPQNGCMGEQVTLMRDLLPYLP